MNFFTLHRRCLLTLFFVVFSLSLRGQFAPPKLIDIDFVSPRFTLFDMDGDGDLDVFTTGSSSILVYVNENSAWTRDSIDLSVFNLQSSRWASLKHADLNGDGMEDLVVFEAAGEASYVGWFQYNPTDQEFELQGKVDFFGYAECFDREFFHFEDLDQDGDLDLFFSVGWDPILVENLDGKGQLGVKEIFPDFRCKSRLIFKDLNGDNSTDLLLGNVVYTNNGEATFDQSKNLVSSGQVTELPSLINDSLISHYLSSISQPVYTISKLTVDSMVFLANSPINNRESIFYHDFNKDGTAEHLRYKNYGEPYYIEYAELDFATFQFNQNVSVYNGQPVERMDALDWDQDGWDDIIIQEGNQLFWMENVSDLPSISGLAYLDVNENGERDAGEVPLANARISSPAINYTIYTNEQGAYTLYAPPGTYSLTAAIFHENLQVSGPDNATVALAFGDAVTGIDFGFSFINPIQDLKISLVSNITRCNSEVRFSLLYENQGSYTASGQIRLQLAEHTDFISSETMPSHIGTEEIIWDFNNLPPFGRAKIELMLSMPSAEFINDTLVFQATIEDHFTAYRETDIYRSLLRCSFDPNDKQVDPPGYGPDHLTLLEEDELEYLVRFQNTGNDTAFQVRITDALHPLLNVETFRVVSASHRYRAEIENRMLTFFFDDILLPDSTTNLEGSQGYVLFRINTQEDPKEGDLITNQANIYFDRNEAIVTNEVVNTYVSYICTELRSEIYQAICAGETYEGYDISGTYTDQFTTVNGCDSSRTLVLTVKDNISTTISREICAGGNVEGYTASGTYTDTFSAANGCDSVRTLVLRVKDNISTTISREICAGGNVEGYTTSGTYTDTFSAANGCDSVRTLVLIVNDNIQTTIHREICEGENVETYTASGTYVDSFTTNTGCDSTRTLVLEVRPAYRNTINVTFCDETLQGDPVTTTEISTFIASNGCDSIVTINSQRLPLETIELDTVICAGDSLYGYGEAGLYVDTLYNTGTCGTIRMLQLNFLDAGDAQCLVSTDDPANYSIHIFPNPVRQHLMIHFEDHLNEKIRIRLLDLQGRLVWKEERQITPDLQLDLSSVAGGMYLLQLNWNRQSTVHKVIKME